jgi:hypothetical protein
MGFTRLVVATLSVVAVTVSGGPSPLSSSFQLTAMAALTDRSKQDVTQTATWQWRRLHRAVHCCTEPMIAAGCAKQDSRASPAAA